VSFRVPFHQARLSPTGAYWLDNASDLSSQDSIQEYAADDPLLSCKQQPLASSSGASSKAAGQRPLWR
jgi:hypothetical protein